MHVFKGQNVMNDLEDLRIAARRPLPTWKDASVGQRITKVFVFVMGSVLALAVTITLLEIAGRAIR